MSLVYQKVEEAKEELLQWSSTVRKHVDTLVMELTKRDALQLVYSAEDHAQALRKEAQTINRCLKCLRCYNNLKISRFTFITHCAIYIQCASYNL